MQQVELTQQQIESKIKQILKKIETHNVKGLMVLIHPNYYIHFLKDVKASKLIEVERVIESYKVPLEGFELVRKI